MLQPVVLCGGSGTRLWPLSRKAYPKQLLPLASNYSLLQETLIRLASIKDAASPMVVCNAEHRFVVAEQIHELGIKDATIILEPEGRNTAPAAALAALQADPDDVLLVVPSDHQIKQSKPFQKAVMQALPCALQDFLVTFAIEPHQPETGYGYLKQGGAIEGTDACHVAEFIEKPCLEKAQAYLAADNYFWNSGMFMFRADVYLQELGRFCPEILAASRVAIKGARKDIDFIRLDEKAFNECPSDSIDYAVMEKSDKVAMIPLRDSQWSDLGSWGSVYESKIKDQDQNVINGDVYTHDVQNCYLQSDSRLLAVVGVKDHIVVETADAVLVAHRDAAQQVKNIVKELEQKERSEIDVHRRVYRPWGYYEVMDETAHFKVKQINVKPGASLSLQKHLHRSEHWVVIKGRAEVVCGEDCFILDASESTYIPAESKHRLRNIGEEPLVIVEVQTGSYLGEDDIIRLEDSYGREVA